MACLNFDGPLCGNTQCRTCWKKQNDGRDFFREWRKKNAHSESPEIIEPFVLNGEVFIVNTNNVQITQDGPGTEFKKIADAFGIQQTGCMCNSLMRQMDKGGSEWCRKNMAVIVSGVRENAVKMGLDVKIKKEWPELWERWDEVVRGLVEEAIRNNEGGHETS